MDGAHFVVRPVGPEIIDAAASRLQNVGLPTGMVPYKVCNVINFITIRRLRHKVYMKA